MGNPKLEGIELEGKGLVIIPLAEVEKLGVCGPNGVALEYGSKGVAGRTSPPPKRPDGPNTGVGGEENNTLGPNSGGRTLLLGPTILLLKLPLLTLLALLTLLIPPLRLPPPLPPLGAGVGV